MQPHAVSKFQNIDHKYTRAQRQHRCITAANILDTSSPLCCSVLSLASVSLSSLLSPLASVSHLPLSGACIRSHHNIILPLHRVFDIVKINPLFGQVCVPADKILVDGPLRVHHVVSHRLVLSYLAIMSTTCGRWRRRGRLSCS